MIVNETRILGTSDGRYWVLKAEEGGVAIYHGYEFHPCEPVGDEPAARVPGGMDEAQAFVAEFGESFPGPVEPFPVVDSPRASEKAVRRLRDRL